LDSVEPTDAAATAAEDGFGESEEMAAKRKLLEEYYIDMNRIARFFMINSMMEKGCNFLLQPWTTTTIGPQAPVGSGMHISAIH